METIRFDELELNPKILRGIKDMGFEEATPIQAFGQGCNRTGADRNRKDSSLWYSGA